MYCNKDGFPMDKKQAHSYERQNCSKKIPSSSEKTKRKDTDWCNEENLVTKDYYKCPKCKHQEDPPEISPIVINTELWHDILNLPNMALFYSVEVLGTDVILLTPDDVREFHNECARIIENVLEKKAGHQMKVYYFKECVKYRRPLTARVRFHLNVLKRCYPSMPVDKLKYYADLFQSCQFSDSKRLEIDLIR